MHNKEEMTRPLGFPTSYRSLSLSRLLEVLKDNRTISIHFVYYDGKKVNVDVKYWDDITPFDSRGNIIINNIPYTLKPELVAEISISRNEPCLDIYKYFLQYAENFCLFSEAYPKTLSILKMDFLNTCLENKNIYYDSLEINSYNKNGFISVNAIGRAVASNFTLTEKNIKYIYNNSKLYTLQLELSHILLSSKEYYENCLNVLNKIIPSDLPDEIKLWHLMQEEDE